LRVPVSSRVHGVQTLLSQRHSRRLASDDAGRSAGLGAAAVVYPVSVDRGSWIVDRGSWIVDRSRLSEELRAAHSSQLRTPKELFGPVSRSRWPVRPISSIRAAIR